MDVWVKNLYHVARFWIIGSEVDIEDIDGVGESQGEHAVEWHEENGIKEALFIDIVDDVIDKPLLSKRIVWVVGTKELEDGDDPIVKLRDGVEDDSDDAAEGRDAKDTKSPYLDELVLGESLGVSILSSVEEKEIGHVNRETEHVQVGKAIVE